MLQAPRKDKINNKCGKLKIMPKINKSIFQIGLYRWEILTVISIIVGGLIIWHVLYPILSFQSIQSKTISRRLSFLKTADQLQAKSLKIKRKNNFLDSLIQASEMQQRFNEPVVLEKLYTYADTAKCTISKVQIDEPLEISSGIEIPVLLSGKGSYVAIGTFIGFIENCNYAIRIRQLTMKNTKKGIAELFLDFVIMESRSK